MCFLSVCFLSVFICVCVFLCVCVFSLCVFLCVFFCVVSLCVCVCVCVWNFSKEVKPVPALLQQRTSMYLFINDFVGFV